MSRSPSRAELARASQPVSYVDAKDLWYSVKPVRSPGLPISSSDSLPLRSGGVASSATPHETSRFCERWTPTAISTGTRCKVCSSTDHEAASTASNGSSNVASSTHGAP